MSLRFAFYLLIILAGTIAGYLKLRYIPKQLKYLTFLLTITFISESISRILALKIHNSNYTYHFYTPIEIILTLFILSEITSIKKNKVIIFCVFSVTLMFSIFNSFLLQPLSSFNSNVDIVKIPLTVFILFLLVFEKINSVIDGNQVLDSDLIVIFAILWFNISSFIFFIGHDYFILKKITTKSLGTVHYISNIVYYTLLLISILIYKPLTFNDYSRK